MQFWNAAELSSKYDGAYTYTHFCKGDDSLKYDGSQFIINEGTLQWNGEKKGYKKDQKKWFGKNCIDKGTLQDYEEYSVKCFGMM